MLIAIGLLMFAFVGYQLWGTGIEYARAQDRLDDEFADLIGATTTATATTTAPATTLGPTTTVDATTTTSSTSTTVAPLPDFAAGDVMARIEIPSIGLDAKVVSGVQPEDLKLGPGHYPDTPMPGQFGNSAIAGHRTTYGQPFFRLDEVAPGDEIVLTTVQGRFVYRATASEIVAADRSDVVATTDPTIARLTLTTCHPRYSATERLIVAAELDAVASAAPQAPVVDTDRADRRHPSRRGVGLDDAAHHAGVGAAHDPRHCAAGGRHQRGAPTPSPTAGSPTTTPSSQVAIWGVALTVISVGAWQLSRAVGRNWIGALAGIVPFVVALYFFFQNVNRLLPAAL